MFTNFSQSKNIIVLLLLYFFIRIFFKPLLYYVYINIIYGYNIVYSIIIYIVYMYTVLYIVLYMYCIITDVILVWNTILVKFLQEKDFFNDLLFFDSALNIIRYLQDDTNFNLVCFYLHQYIDCHHIFKIYEIH